MIDFHSHILPGIDDGAENPEISVEMLKQAADAGIDTIIATPHFNTEDTTVDGFLKKRANSARLLEQALKKAEFDVPEILLAAEVYLLPETAEADGIEKLCIQGTNCMLVEMPVGRWTEWVFNEIYKLRQLDIVPVMAHLERYAVYKENFEKILRLLEMEVCVQINADDAAKLKYRKAIKAFAERCEMTVIGSDTHDPIRRPNRMKKAVRVLKKRFGSGFAEEMETNAKMLLTGDFSF